MGLSAEYKSIADTQLVKLLKEGDQMAFIEIYDRYWPPLLLHAHRMLGDENLAKDAVQEIFTLLFQQSKSVNINSSLSAYLYKAVRNRVLTDIKDNKVKMDYAEDFHKYTKDVEDLVDEQVALKELAKTIESEIEKMPKKMREILSSAANRT